MQQEELTVLRRIVAPWCDAERSSVMLQCRANCEALQPCLGWSAADETAVSNAIEKTPSGATYAANARGPEQHKGADECRRVRRDSDEKPSGLLEQRSTRCRARETQQAETGDPALVASWASPAEPWHKRLAEACGDHEAASVASAIGAPEQVSSRGRISDAQLKCWMEKVRARCEVVDSSAEAAVDDVVWSDAPLGGQEAEAGDRMVAASRQKLLQPASLTARAC